MLNIKQLSVRIAATQKPAVDDFTLAIPAGQTTALVGESGSGKSMTALAIMRLLPEGVYIDQGQIYLQNTELLQLSEAQMRGIRAKRIAMIFQEPATCLNPVLRIGDQLMESIALHTHYKGQALRDQAVLWLKRVGIDQAEQRLNDYPFQFSGGQRQRIMIAMALATEPDLLIADEPTTALDVTVQAQILQLLMQMKEQLGLTLLLITHDLAVVQKVADQVALMRDGQLVYQSDAYTFFAQPKHPYARQLLKAIPSFAQRQSKYGTTAFKPQAGAQPVLHIKELSVSYKQKNRLFKPSQDIAVVKGLNLDVYAGQTVALLGASGCGKSTVAKSLLRIIDDQTRVQGQAQLMGQDLLYSKGAALRTQRQKIQIVFQDPFSSLNPRMMVGDILAEGIKSLHPQLSAQQRQQRIQKLLDLTAMPSNSAYRYAHEFSGGQRQRIAIARALAVEPAVLICDEPTSALDVSVQAQILDLLLQLQQETALAYLFITHNFSVVEYVADQVAIMDQGHIVEQGSALQVLTQPIHPVTQQLLASVPRLQLSSLAV